MKVNHVRTYNAVNNLTTHSLSPKNSPNSDGINSLEADFTRQLIKVNRTYSSKKTVEYYIPLSQVLSFEEAEAPKESPQAKAQKLNKAS